MNLFAYGFWAAFQQLISYRSRQENDIGVILFAVHERLTADSLSTGIYQATSTADYILSAVLENPTTTVYIFSALLENMSMLVKKSLNSFN